ncbi:MAG: hypothetical protein AAGU15_00335 [Anaerolineaceae bacterium]
MKNFKKLSVILICAILIGLIGAASSVQVEAQSPTTRMTVLELVTSPT